MVGCKLAVADIVHAFIYIRQVGFVKCHEWRVACNRPTLACPRKIAAAIAFEVALRVASVARSVFMTSQLYRRLSALSVLSRYCWVVNACWLPPVICEDTILMLYRSTSPLEDRASPLPVRLSVSDLPRPSKLHSRTLWALCAAAHSYNAAAIRRPICRRSGTEPEPTGLSPNQGSGRFGYYFGY